MFNLPFLGMSILYPRGRKALNPTMRSGCSWKSCETRRMTPGVSMLEQRTQMGKSVSGSQLKTKSISDSRDSAPKPASHWRQSTLKYDWGDSADCDLLQKQPDRGSLCHPGENHRGMGSFLWLQSGPKPSHWACGRKPDQPCHISSEEDAAWWGCDSRESKSQRAQVLVLSLHQSTQPQ